MSALVSRSLQLMARNSMATVGRRNLHIHTEGIPGSTLPFRIDGKYRTLITFSIYMGSGLAFPFLIVVHQMKKASGQYTYMQE